MIFAFAQAHFASFQGLEILPQFGKTVLLNIALPKIRSHSLRVGGVSHSQALVR